VGSDLRITGLTAGYGGNTVLSVEELVIEGGEFLSVLGPSGCGKTTLLNCLAGFVQPATGQITLDGEDLTRVPPHRRGLGLVFQSYALFPHMTVADNVAYGLRAQRVPKTDRRERIAEVLRLVGLEDYADRRPRQLSGGQQQRVAVARALATKPGVLLLDEPLSNLDAKLRREMRAELRALQKELGITAVFVTHDQEEAMSMSDRVAVLSGGRIEQLGAPESVYNHPATRFVAEFVGAANVVTWDGALVAIRPERVRLDEAGTRRATVTATSFTGGSWHVDLEIDDGTQLSARVTEPPPAPGSPTGVNVNPEDIIQFEA
jgi:putative spermidine/putrescine transport system ATP-binding protein